jgi:uncharacterized BrkB/YihY/UPF0761 family membrane protein
VEKERKGRILRHERKRPVLKGGWQIPQKAFVLLRKNDPLRMAGATAFFTSFSLPFILIILIQLFGLVLNPGKLSDHLFRSLSYILGHPGVRQIRDTLQGFQRLATNAYIAVGGFIFLLFVVTTLFKVIKDSINQLWEVQITEGRLADTLLPRLRAILLILLAGLLFLLDVAGEAFLVVLRDSISGLGFGDRARAVFYTAATDFVRDRYGMDRYPLPLFAGRTIFFRRDLHRRDIDRRIVHRGEIFPGMVAAVE